MTESYKAFTESATSTSNVSRTTGRAKMTRSEAARHAALVRYGKENPFQARLAEIRALRQAKQAAAVARQKKLLAGGKGGKGKGKTGGKGKAAKPKADPKAKQAEREKAKAAKQAERDKAKVARDQERAGKQAERAKAKTAADEKRKTAQAERDKARAAREQERQKRAAEREKASKEKAKAAQEKAQEKAKERAKSSDKANTPKDKDAETAKNRATVDSKTTSAGVDSAGMNALSSLANGDSVDDKTASALEKIGLVERDSEGKPRMTTQARALMRARDKGDAGAAMDAISRAKDTVAARAERAKATAQRASDQEDARRTRQQQQQDRATSRAAQQKTRAANAAARILDRLQQRTTKTGDIPMSNPYTPILDDLRAIIAETTDISADESAIKVGNRNNASDQATIDQGYELACELCDLFEALGADTGEEDDEAPDAEDEGEEDMAMDNADEMKAISDNPVAYAYQECGGIQQATDALRILAQLAASEASEQDDDTSAILSQLRQAMLIITGYINGEIGELKAIGAREDVNPKEGIAQYGKGAIFADEKNKKYPLSDEQGALDEGKIRAAWNYINKPDNAGKYQPDEVDAIKKKIVAAWKDKIDKSGPPSAQEATKKSIDLATKGIEFISPDDGEEIAVVPGYNVKATGDNDGWVSGYLVKFGGGGDLSQWRDIFTKSTDFGSHRKSDVYVHHRMLPGLGKQRLTNQAELSVDEVGVFMKHLLNLRSGYERALYGMVQQDKLGLSSGTAPHLVERKAIDGGKHEVALWPIGLDASYTPTPAGGFDVNASAMKSIFDDAGIDLLNALYDQSADDDRARRILLDLSLLELEAA